MSFKFQHDDKQFWAKEIKGVTEVYFLEHKGLAEKIADVPGKFTNSDDLITQVLSTKGLPRAHALLKRHSL